MTLTARNISFTYPSSGFGLRDISLHAAGGGMVGVIGANGSGKTTLLKLLCGLLLPDSGAIMLDEQPLGLLSSAARSRTAAYLPQSHRPAFEFTVEQTVLLGRIPHLGAFSGYERPEDLEMAERAIRSMELERYRTAPITELSGGELQRVMIARALAQDPRVLVLDEPQSHLDIAHQFRVLEMLRDHARSQNVAVIASLHDLNLASMFCDYLAVMTRGRLTGFGTPAETLTEEALNEAFGIRLEIWSDAYKGAPAVGYRRGVIS